MNDIVDFLVRLENDEIDNEQEIIEGYQQLIDSGVIYDLQDSYQRMAQQLVDEGLCYV